MEYNHYDAVISDLGYYAGDKRRTKDFREVVGMASTELTLCNMELKECRKLLHRLICARENLSRVEEEIREYIERTTNNE